MQIIELRKVYDRHTELIEQTRTEQTFENSLQVHELIINSIGSVILDKQFIYEENTLTKIIESFSGEVEMIKEYFYDEFNNKLREVWTNFQNVKVFESQVNAAKHEMRNYEFDQEGNVISSQVNTMNVDGKIIREVEDQDFITEYSYDEENCIACKMYEYGQLQVEEQYFFDESGNEIGSEGINHETNEKVTIKKEYNSVNKLILEKQFVNDQLDLEKVISYDSQNRILSIKSSASNEKKVIEYQYID